jgi:hypothetical protein
MAGKNSARAIVGGLCSAMFVTGPGVLLAQNAPQPPAPASPGNTQSSPPPQTSAEQLRQEANAQVSPQTADGFNVQLATPLTLDSSSTVTT